ncbi:MAG: hypothetical protein ACI909_000462 [Planctomycetota bacterium]|jgi:hypothetical protein
MTRLSLYLLLIVSGPGFVYADDQDLMLEEPDPAKGKGVIIELEEEGSGRTEKASDSSVVATTNKKKKEGKRRIELIVGGQGEDGVAKRSSLIIDE